MVQAPAIVGCEVVYSSPWLEVAVKEVELGPPRGRESFWSVRTAGDYAAVVAVTEDGLIPLVRLFRPAVEAHTLELPSGFVEPGEQPAVAVRRELLEETGCEAGELVELGVLYTDTGRMETRQHAFFAPGVRAAAAEPHEDEGIELVFVEPAELRGVVERGELRTAPHVAVICRAALAGHIGW